jgi:dihydroorotase
MKKIVIDEGENVNMTLFNPELEWIFIADDIKSKSNNTPFIGEQLKGRALAIINNGQFKEC